MADQAICSILDDGKPVKRERARRGEPLRFYNQVVLTHESDACLMWPFGLDAWGYGTLQYCGSRGMVHRLICEVEHGQRPTPKHEAAHRCGKAACVNRRHIRWATPAENCADKLLHGTINRGERNGAVRLTETKALEAIKLKGILSQRAIARKLGVGQTTIRDIHDGKTWGWLWSDRSASSTGR